MYTGHLQILSMDPLALRYGHTGRGQRIVALFFEFVYTLVLGLLVARPLFDVVRPYTESGPCLPMIP